MSDEKRRAILVYVTDRERRALEELAGEEERSLSTLGRRILLNDPAVKAKLRR